MSLCIIGTLAYDSIETPFGSVENALGGSATYISLSASYFTRDIGIVSIVGDDFSQNTLDYLAGRGIDTSGVQIREGGKTFRWSGRYHHDLNNRDTLDTQLNVLTEFDPVIPEAMRSAKFVCLGNFDPTLQLKVLDQMEDPLFTVCDTMNFWIEGAFDQLKEVLARVDCLIINDSEARLISKDPNLIKSAHMIMKMGPKVLIIKKGEHGALLFLENDIFSAPAFPLEDIFDPTGAGDTFAGGFIGYLARAGSITPSNLRKAVINGSAMASFCVEQFSVDALKELPNDKINHRVKAFRQLSHFEYEEVLLENAGT